MLPKVFMLLILMSSPEGNLGPGNGGQFETAKECFEQALVVKKRMKEQGIPTDAAMLVCMETIWTVKGGQGV